MESIGNLVQDLVPLASLHLTSEPLSDSSEDEEGDSGSPGAAEKKRDHPHRRHLNRRKRARIMRKNPFAEMAAHNIPALADVLLDEGEMEEEEVDELDEAVYHEAVEEADDAACTDNDSEEEGGKESSPVKLQYPHIIGHSDGSGGVGVALTQWPGQGGVTTISQSPVVVTRAGPTKRACITAYSDQPSPTTTAVTSHQAQYIYATTSNSVGVGGGGVVMSTATPSTVVPIQLAAPNGLQQQFATITQTHGLNTQTKVRIW